MRNRRRIFILLLAVLGMLGLASAARHWIANHSLTDTKGIIFTDHYRLTNTINDDLVVVGDTVVLGIVSHVTGDAALVGQGAVIVSGEIDGDLTVLADTLRIASTSHISGDLAFMGNNLIIDGHVDGDMTLVGGKLAISRYAQINGDAVGCLENVVDNRINAPPVRPCENNQTVLAQFASLQALSRGVDLPSLAASGGLTGGGLLFSVSASLLLTGLSALAVVAFPRRFSHIQEAILSNPRNLAALGCMALLLGVGVSAGIVAVLSIIPPLALILIPIGLLLGLGLLSMVVTGWITLALLLGDAVLRHATHNIQPPVIAVATGSLILFALWHVLAIIPFGSVIGLLLMGVLGSAGLGGTLATRMGGRPLGRRYFVQG
jgi:hypothetical protein